MNDIADLLEELHDYGWTLDEFGIEEESGAEYYILKNDELHIHVWFDPREENRELDMISIVADSANTLSLSSTLFRYELECINKFLNTVTSIHNFENESVVQIIKRLKEKEEISAKSWEED